MKDARSTKLKRPSKPAAGNRLEHKAADNRNAGFYVADKNGNISVASNSLAMMLRYSSKKEVLGLNMAEKLYENKSDRGEFLKKLTEEGRVEGYAVNMICKDGTRVVLSAHSTLLCDEKGEPIGVEGILEEVAQEKTTTKAKERPVPDLVPIDENAEGNFDGLMKDPLTGLYNYQYFMICLNAEIKRVERLFHPTCLMMIDLDNFSNYNQKNGRPKGDELLKIVAGLLKENLRTTDILCRQAQDQFLVILLETKKDEALDLSKKVKDSLQTALTDKNITCSIGMSRFILGMTAQEFFLQANVGLYMAKVNGKNEACIYG
jgi:diguanylate cyclase (GGDEF)-like protein/PAS domain S-box-containing protein